LDEEGEICLSNAFMQGGVIAYPLINRARQILWVVTGSKKVKPLGQLLNSMLTPQFLLDGFAGTRRRH
jgi:hypothetical protein